MARLDEYNFELAKKICEEVANGKSVIKVLLDNEEYPSWSTFRRWKSDHEELQTQYMSAIQDKADFCLFEIDEICKEMKEGTLDYQVGRIIVDTLKWKASKFYPKMYGTTPIDFTSGGERIAFPEWLK